MPTHKHKHLQEQEKLKAAATPPPLDPERSWNLYLAPIIRETLYAPDGEPPVVNEKPWSIARDLRICKMILKRGRVDATQIEAAIRGLRKLYPGRKLTLRLLMADKDGSLYRRAVEAYYQTQKRAPAHHLADIMATLAKKGTAA